jgi:hypothetical protein
LWLLVPQLPQLFVELLSDSVLVYSPSTLALVRW